MITLVLPPRTNEDCLALAEAARLSGWEVYFAPGWRLNRAEIPGDRFIVFADPPFTRLIP